MRTALATAEPVHGEGGECGVPAAANPSVGGSEVKISCLCECYSESIREQAGAPRKSEVELLAYVTKTQTCEGRRKSSCDARIAPDIYISMKPQIRFVAVALFLFLGAVAAQSQVVVYSNLDANDSATGSSTIVGGSANFFDSRLAAAFTVSGGPFAFSAVDLVVDAFSSGVDQLTIFLYSNDGMTNLPGTVLETLTWTGPAITGRETIEATSLLHTLLLTGQTYWIAMTPSGTSADKAALWVNNSIGPNGDPIPVPAARTNSNASDPWASEPNAQPAFRVLAVPEPAICALLASGAVLVLVTIRRKRV
jgi:hypothetical protein